MILKLRISQQLDIPMMINLTLFQGRQGSEAHSNSLLVLMVIAAQPQIFGLLESAYTHSIMMISRLWEKASSKSIH